MAMQYSQQLQQTVPIAYITKPTVNLMMIPGITLPTENSTS